jgi:hypothetical protein
MDETDEGHQHEQRLPEVTTQVGPTCPALDQIQRRSNDPTTCARIAGGDGLLHDAWPHDAETCLGLRSRETVARPREHLQPGRGRFEPVRLLREDLREDADSERDLGNITDLDSAKWRRAYAHDRHRPAFDDHRPSDDLWIAREPARPVAIGDHRNGSRAGAIVARRQEAAQRRLQAERVVVRPAYPGAARALECIRRTDGERRVVESEQPGEDTGRLLSQTADKGIRIALARLGVASQDRQLHELLRVSDRQPSQQQRVDEREDRRVRADAEGKRQDDHGGEPAILPQRSNRVSKVLRQRIETWPSSLIAIGFPDLLHAAEVAARGGARLLGGHSVSDMCLREQIQMRPDLVVQRNVTATSRQDRQETRGQCAK